MLESPRSRGSRNGFLVNLMDVLSPCSRKFKSMNPSQETFHQTMTLRGSFPNRGISSHDSLDNRAYTLLVKFSSHCKHFSIDKQDFSEKVNSVRPRDVCIFPF